MTISDDKLQELTESHYLRGQRSVLIQQLHNILRELSISYIDDAPQNLMTIARLVAEREDAIAALRSVCDDHGDNDWSEEMHLADIVNKHLKNHLDE